MKYKQKSMFEMTGDDSLLFPTKPLLYLVSIWYCWMENHFSEVKRPQTHLLMSYSIIRIMGGYK